MQRDDIKEAIPPLGLRIEFREKLFKWKKLEFGIDDDTISVNSKVDNWLIDKGDFHGKQVLNKCLANVLKESQSGRSIIDYENKNKNLTTDHRNNLIKIIVEEAIFKQIQIRIQDFPLLLREIVWIFPSEENVQDYYFISRGNNRSPSGKLFSKYKNFRAKRFKCDNSVSNQDESNGRENTSQNSSSQIDETIEVDESIAKAFKTSLNRDSADWSDVCEKWKKTYQICRRELFQLHSGDFLKSWSKLSHVEASELIEIDFDFLYPDKRLMLFSKWEEFKTNILRFYETNITNEVCRQQLAKAKETTNIDYQDYLITILLIQFFHLLPVLKIKMEKKQRRRPLLTPRKVLCCIYKH